jgi:hypothetical protein
VRALPNNLVFAQVQLSRFFTFKRGVARQTWFKRISQLSADFVILGPDTSADTRKAHALQSAGVRLIRWHAKTLADEAAIRAPLPPMRLILEAPRDLKSLGKDTAPGD